MDSRVSAFLCVVVLGALVAPSFSSDESDAACLAASKAYVRAILTCDHRPVPLHPECVRVENGYVYGSSGRWIAFLLDYEPGHLLIKNIKNETYVVQDGKVISSYYLDLKVLLWPATEFVAENFTCRAHEGVQKLWRIEATWGWPSWN